MNQSAVHGRAHDPPNKILLCSFADVQMVVSIDQIESAFAVFGPLAKLVVFDKRRTGMQSFIEFFELDDAIAAQRALDGQVLNSISPWMSHGVRADAHDQFYVGAVTYMCVSLWMCAFTAGVASGQLSNACRVFAAAHSCAQTRRLQFARVPGATRLCRSAAHT
jgi:hypothetical protein